MLRGYAVRVDDILVIVILILAYAVTWVLFFESLHVIKTIHKEKLLDLDSIKRRILRWSRPS